ISRIENGVVIPSKLMNVFRDDSMMTYENKFVNTLLSRLYEFVAMRFEAAKEGADKELIELEVTGKLDFEDINATFSTRYTIAAPKSDSGKNYGKNSELYGRARKLYEAVSDYKASEFAQHMGNAFIHPPVMRTNAILKNKNMRQCLMLWEFIEGYEDEGGLSAEEKECEISEEYKQQIFRNIAEQYLVFRRNALSAKKKQEKAAITVLSPDFSEASAAFSAAAETTTEKERNTQELVAIEAAIRADVIADEAYRAEKERRRAEKLAREEAERLAREEAEKAARAALEAELKKSAVDAQPVVMPDKAEKYDTDEEKGEGFTAFRKSLEAKLRLADEHIKEYYTGIYNKFVSRAKVRARMSFGHVTFSHKGTPLALMTIIGKTLRVYYALGYETVEPKYNAVDCSEIKKYAATPTMLKVRSKRAYGYALELAERLVADIPEAKAPELISADKYPQGKLEQLVSEGLVQKEVKNRLIGKPFALEKKFKRLELQKTETEEDYSADYLAEAKKLIEKEKENPVEGKTIHLEGVVKSGDVYKVLKDTEDKLEKERLEKLKEEYAEKPVEKHTSGGDGDALMAREEATSSSPIITALPEKEKEEPVEQKPVTEVNVGGDALLPKPISVADIGKEDRYASQHKSTPNTVKKEKKSIFSRLFKRRDD
ncbi:MAG: hypothetical protein J5903_02160, partial [Clostridia bacterium]|nr:hypothetical protein [Clostridia bacterium]